MSDFFELTQHDITYRFKNGCFERKGYVLEVYAKDNGEWVYKGRMFVPDYTSKENIWFMAHYFVQNF